MKVLHVIYGVDPVYGGPVTALVGLAQAQRLAGWDVSVVSPLAEGKDDLRVAQRLQTKGIEVQALGPAKTPLMLHPQLKSTVWKMVSEADIVHIHGIWEEVQHQAARAALHFKKPYIIRPCGMLAPWDLARGRLKKQAYLSLRLRKNLNLAAALHFTTQEEMDLVTPAGFLAPGIVEPNGVALEEFKNLPPLGSFRALYPKISDKKIVLFLSRIHEKKGLDLLIPAFAATQKELNNAVLVIAGPGEEDYLQEVHDMVKSAGIEDQVVFTGMLHGTERISSMVDAYVFSLPSYHENFGNSIVEALAAGTPVLISDKVNIHPLITEAQVGAVTPTTIEAVQTELSRWLSDDELREEAASRAIPFVNNHYDWQKIGRRWTEHYLKFIEKTK